MRHRFPVSPRGSLTATGHRSEDLELSPKKARILASKANSLKNINLMQMELTLTPWRPIVRAMDSNLSLLDQKLSQLIALLDQSREQNVQLRARLETAEARAQELETQMNTARNKLEQVVARLPESVNLS